MIGTPPLSRAPSAGGRAGHLERAGEDAVAQPAARSRRASRAARASKAVVALFSVLVPSVVTVGWMLRARLPLTPESGPGYALGVAGGVTLLLLTSYSARKRLRFMRRWGPVSRWFRVHMLLGVLAPVLILFHCNFRLGAPNSNVALGSMLVVAVSGVVGRYIYTRVSHGLYGARATLAELHAELDASARALGEEFPPASRAAQDLAAFAIRVQTMPRTMRGRLVRLVVLPLSALRVRHRVLHDLRADLELAATRRGWDTAARRAHGHAARDLADTYLAALVKEAQFGAYERVFALWHALHVPLFIMLILTGVMHVVAVHMY